MNRLPIYVLLSICMALVAGMAHGKACEGVSFPDQVQSAGTTLQLNGLGLRQATFLKVDVYVAALYISQMSGDADAILEARAPKEIVLHFVRDVDQSKLNEGWDEGFEKNAKDQLPVLKDRIEAFKAMMVDVSKGQRLRFVYQPGKGVEVDVDGTPKGTIAGDDFARALFAIWLGSHPPNDDLKAGLLGGACG